MSKYIHFNLSTRELPESCIRLYPLVCLHVGAAQCDVSFIEEHVKRIKEDPNAYWVYMGDGGECVTKYSKGDIYAQILSPQKQVEMLNDLLEPIKGKGLFGIRGNHGHRVYKETGLEFDHALCTMLGIPYLGVCAFANLLINRTSYDCYFHHGGDSGTSSQAKLNKAESFGRFVDTDAIFTAHSHVAMELSPAILESCDNNTQKVYTKLRHQYICGTAYDSRSGYAEEKGYPPLLPAYLSVEFDGRIIEGRTRRRQTHKVFRSDGQHELKHDYLPRYI
jgi:hypothetical protein